MKVCMLNVLKMDIMGQDSLGFCCFSLCSFQRLWWRFSVFEEDDEVTHT